jgi:RNA recognition motif-containing protein
MRNNGQSVTENDENDNEIDGSLLKLDPNIESEEEQIIRVFSQFGEIIDCWMPRFKPNTTNNPNKSANNPTGNPPNKPNNPPTKPQSRGFCFIAYEDQRSTNLAVDNMNGSTLNGQILRVDHAKNFRLPKNLKDNLMVGIKQEAEEREIDDIENHRMYSKRRKLIWDNESYALYDQNNGTSYADPLSLYRHNIDRTGMEIDRQASMSSIDKLGTTAALMSQWVQLEQQFTLKNANNSANSPSNPPSTPSTSFTSPPTSSTSSNLSSESQRILELLHRKQSLFFTENNQWLIDSHKDKFNVNVIPSVDSESSSNKRKK